MFDLAHGYAKRGDECLFPATRAGIRDATSTGFTAVKHQSFVGAGYFDLVHRRFSGGESSTTALHGSTEEAQFTKPVPQPVVLDERRMPAPAIRRMTLRIGDCGPSAIPNPKSAIAQWWRTQPILTIQTNLLL